MVRWYAYSTAEAQMTLTDTNTHAFALPSLGSLGSVASGIGSFFGGAGGYILIALLVAFAGFAAYEEIRIGARDSEIAALHAQIDGPTGYIAQIGRARSDVAVANANIADLTKNVASLNAQIDKLAVDSKAAVDRSRALQGALADAQARAASVAQVLAAQRPQVASYAALTGLIKQRVGM